MGAIAMTAEQANDMMTKRFLDYVRSTSKDEYRTYMHHYISDTVAGVPLLAATDGHRMNIAPVAHGLPQGCCVDVNDVSKSMDCYTPRLSNIDGVDGANDSDGPVRLTLTHDHREILLAACAAAQGMTARLRKEWLKEPKKKRSTAPLQAFVHITGGEYRVQVLVGANNRNAISFRTTLDERASQEFVIALDANYLKDALDALMDVAFPWHVSTDLLMCVKPAPDGRYSTEAATFRISGGSYPGTIDATAMQQFKCLVMPVRA